MTGQLFRAPVQPLDSDERFTPAWVFEHLGVEFDLDPCSPIAGGDCVPSRTRYTIEDDGLTQPWHGTVWVNPPFSNTTGRNGVNVGGPRPWAERFIRHADGIFLGPIASAKWRTDLLEVADLVWLADDFAFTHPTHAGKRTSMPIMFVAIGGTGVDGLRRLHRSKVHRGCLLTVGDEPGMMEP